MKKFTGFIGYQIENVCIIGILGGEKRESDIKPI
jgi:hypothetical protein